MRLLHIIAFYILSSSIAYDINVPGFDSLVLQLNITNTVLLPRILTNWDETNVRLSELINSGLLPIVSKIDPFLRDFNITIKQWQDTNMILSQTLADVSKIVLKLEGDWSDTNSRLSILESGQFWAMVLGIIVLFVVSGVLVCCFCVIHMRSYMLKPHIPNEI